VDEASGISTERAEVLLVRARLTGRMEPDDYQRQMAVVARSDDVRNPLEVPRLRGR
jgi:hypothetical protein